MLSGSRDSEERWCWRAGVGNRSGRPARKSSGEEASRNRRRAGESEFPGGSEAHESIGTATRWKHGAPSTDSKVEQGPEGERPHRQRSDDERHEGRGRRRGDTATAEGKALKGVNPKSACRVKQTDEVERGESRQEGEKPWRRKGDGGGNSVVADQSGFAEAECEKRTLPAHGAVGEENLKRGAARGTGGGYEQRCMVSPSIGGNTERRPQGQPGALLRKALKRRKACERMTPS